jgi:uncharacterized protein YwgA
MASQLADMEASFGKTKLVKLLYLIDIDNYRSRGEKLTGLNWKFYYYGPYSAEIDDALKKLDLYIAEEEIITTTQHRAFIYKPQRDAEESFLEEASYTEHLLVDRVLKKWGLEELNPILSYVYFHTEPMKGAKRGDVLDFTKITQESVWSEQDKPLKETPDNHLKDMHDNFLMLRMQRLKQVGKNLYPEPRFDGVFWSGLAYLEKEELYSVPSGDIYPTDDFKEQLQSQGETE